MDDKIDIGYLENRRDRFVPSQSRKTTCGSNGPGSGGLFLGGTPKRWSVAIGGGVIWFV